MSSLHRNGHVRAGELRALIWPERRGEERKAYDRRLIAAFGGDAGILIGQLVFWTDKSALEGGWLWKSAQDITDETGLSEHRQKKARKILRARGVLEERRVSRRRPLHFRVNLLTLAEVLGVEVPEYLKLGSSTEHLKLGSGTEYGTLESSTEYLKLGSPTTESTSIDNVSGDYETRDSTLQVGGEPAQSAEPPPHQKINITEFLGQNGALPGDDKRHSQDGDTPEPKLAKEVEAKVLHLIYGYPEETAVSRLADRYVEGKTDADGETLTVECVAEKAREAVGGDEPLEAYDSYVLRCLEALELDKAEGVA